MRRVMQRLRQILQEAPHQQIQRARILLLRASNDPLRGFRRGAIARIGRGLYDALLGHGP